MSPIAHISGGLSARACSARGRSVPLSTFILTHRSAFVLVQRSFTHRGKTMPVDLAHIRQVMLEADCLYTEAEVEAAIAQVAAAINDELAERNPVVFCVMNGGLIFSGKLLPKLDFPLELSYLHATRYRNETSGGELFWKAKPEISFIDRDVLIIDDILDEGHTLGAIIDFCRHAGARNVRIAVLVDKTHDRKARPDLKADYVGMSCVDRYVFGYGMDYKGYWRNAPGIYAVKGL